MKGKRLKMMKTEMKVRKNNIYLLNLFYGYCFKIILNDFMLSVFTDETIPYCI